jgi:hypothetical protein
MVSPPASVIDAAAYVVDTGHPDLAPVLLREVEERQHVVTGDLHLSRVNQVDVPSTRLSSDIYQFLTREPLRSMNQGR